MPKLFKRHRLVIAEYMKNGFHQRKAMRACGYSEQTVINGSHVLFNHPAVKEEIDRLMALKFESEGITEERIIAELGRLAFFNMSNIEVVSDDGKSVSYDFRKMDHMAKSAIKSIQTDETVEKIGDLTTTKTRFRVTAWDKPSALISLGRIKGMFNDSLVIKDEKEALAALAIARKQAATEIQEDDDDEG